jgi:hypothetical protein
VAPDEVTLLTSMALPLPIDEVGAYEVKIKQPRPPSKWKFSRRAKRWFCFADLWRPAPNGTGDAFTLLATAPGPEVAPMHDRQNDGMTGRRGLNSPSPKRSSFAVPAGALRRFERAGSARKRTLAEGRGLSEFQTCRPQFSFVTAS